MRHRRRRSANFPPKRECSPLSALSRRSSPPAVELAAQPGVVVADKSAHGLLGIDEAAEARLRRKFDLRLLPTVIFIYLCARAILPVFIRLHY